MTSLVATAFIIALLPLISLACTVVSNGLARFDIAFFTESMRNVVGEGGGALHAIVGTLLDHAAWRRSSRCRSACSPSIYLVEYGRGLLARGDHVLRRRDDRHPLDRRRPVRLRPVRAALRRRASASASWARSRSRVLMIPVVVRSSEEMLQLVPNELREASYALGVPKWLTVLKVVLPTSIAGITTGVMLAIARVIGETAPLLIIARLHHEHELQPVQRADDDPAGVRVHPVRAAGRHRRAGLPSIAPGPAALTLILIVDAAQPRRPHSSPRSSPPSAAAEPGTADPKESHVSKRIEVNDLNVYYCQFLAVEDVSLTIEPRTVTAFIGPSGCGKSTFLRTLNRMHEVIPGARVEGEVLIDGNNLYGPGVDPVLVRRQVGMVFQRPNPFPTMSIRDNVLAGVEAQQPAHVEERTPTTSSRSRCSGANLWNEVKDRLAHAGLRPLGRPAAASVHRPRHRGLPRGHPHGRAVLGPRPDLDPRHRGPHRGAQAGVHDRHRDPQHAAGLARLRPHRVLQHRGHRQARQAHRVRRHHARCSRTRACRPPRTTSPAASVDLAARSPTRVARFAGVRVRALRKWAVRV